MALRKNLFRCQPPLVVRGPFPALANGWTTDPETIFWTIAVLEISLTYLSTTRLLLLADKSSKLLRVHVIKTHLDEPG